MADFLLEQAIYGTGTSGGYQFLAQSPGFREEWRALAEQICTRFGDRPAGVTCPACVFSQPFERQHVVVVQVADQGVDDAGRPGAIAFRLLLLPRHMYEHLGDPFAIADRYPPPWDARGELPVLEWTGGPLPPRTVEDVQRVLKTDNGPALLGGVQALLDGSRLVFERARPDGDLVRGLWTLLPHSSRAHLWPASFAFSNALGFDALVVAQANAGYQGYLTEEQAKDYPEGRYELSLQTAAEAADQASLDHLFARRSMAQTWRLGLILLAVFAVVVLCIKVFTPQASPPPPPAPPKQAPVKLELPPASDFPALSPQEQADLRRALWTLANELGVKPMPDPGTPEQLIAAIDAKLGTPDAGHDPGKDVSEGPPERRLRALLWKQGVPEYRQQTLKGGELVERLRRKLVEEKHIPEKP
jgi:hypothetical protein